MINKILLGRNWKAASGSDGRPPRRSQRHFIECYSWVVDRDQHQRLRTRGITEGLPADARACLERTLFAAAMIDDL
jgi:hypothetical protein